MSVDADMGLWPVEVPPSIEVLCREVADGVSSRPESIELAEELAGQLRGWARQLRKDEEAYLAILRRRLARGERP